MKAIQRLAVAATVFSLPLAANAFGIDHTDRPTCYLSIHSQCFIESDPPCSDEDYQWGLDACDQYYPQQIAIPPMKPLGLKASTSSQRINPKFRQKVKMNMRRGS